MSWQCHGQIPGWHIYYLHIEPLPQCWKDQTSESANPNGHDEVVFTRNVETIEAFSSWVISIKAEKAYT